MTDAKEEGVKPKKDNAQTQDPKSIEDTDANTKADKADGELFDSEPKSNEKDLDLEDEKIDKDTKSAQEKAAEKQRQAWLLKVIEGKAAVEDAPKWLRVSLATELKALEKASSIDVDAKIDEKFKQREAQREFQQLKATINELELSTEQKDELASEYKDLRMAGLSDLDALKKAIKIIGIQITDSTDNLKQAMQIPQSGLAPREPIDYDTPEKILKIPDSRERALKFAELSRRARKQ